MSVWKRCSRLAAVSVLAALAVSFTSPTGVALLEPIPQDQAATGLGLALRRLPVTGRVLYVTAHADDEKSGVLVRLSRGLGLRIALLTVTRGHGGQNEIRVEHRLLANLLSRPRGR